MHVFIVIIKYGFIIESYPTPKQMIMNLYYPFYIQVLLCVSSRGSVLPVVELQHLECEFLNAVFLDELKVEAKQQN